VNFSSKSEFRLDHGQFGSNPNGRKTGFSPNIARRLASVRFADLNEAAGAADTAWVAEHQPAVAEVRWGHK